MNKYKITEEKIKYRGKTLKRIQALKDFGHIRKGQKGGWVEGEWNLSQWGNCWVGGEAKVYEKANVLENAFVTDNAIINCNAMIWGNAKVGGEVHIWNNAKIFDNAEIFGSCLVFGSARVAGNAKISGFAKIYGDAYVSSNIEIRDNVEIFGDFTETKQNLRIGGDAKLSNSKGEIEIYSWHPLYPLVITKKPKTLYHLGDFTGTHSEFLKFICLKNLTII